MTPGFGARTTGRMELKFPQMVKAELGAGKRRKFKTALLDVWVKIKVGM